MAVVFGMIGVTCFGLLFTPAFYTFIRKLGRGERHDWWGYHITSGEAVDMALDAEPPIRRIYAFSVGGKPGDPRRERGVTSLPSAPPHRAPPRRCPRRASRSSPPP